MSLTRSDACDEQPSTPPSAWDDWAMRRANRVYDDIVKMHMGSDARCRAAIHVALIDAMSFATDGADPR